MTKRTPGPIKLGTGAELDLQALVNSRLLVQANSGGGKSWLIRRLLEQTDGLIQRIVIDMEGEFSTLREKHDMLLAAADGDIPAETRTARLFARRVLELGVSTIIDLYELPQGDRRRYVRLFLDSLVNAPKRLWQPCLVIVDEAHALCPEKGQAESGQAIIDLATRGRKRGFCLVLATQRLSKLHKDAAAEMLNKLIGRTGLDIDMRRASDELGFSTKEQRLSLRDLRPGEFYAFGPALSTGVTKIRVGKVRTTHPRAGGRIRAGAPTPPTSRIKALLTELQDLPQEAEREMRTIADHKAEIGRLSGRVVQLEREAKRAGHVDGRDVAAKTATQIREAEARGAERVAAQMAEKYGRAAEEIRAAFEPIGDQAISASEKIVDACIAWSREMKSLMVPVAKAIRELEAETKRKPSRPKRSASTIDITELRLARVPDATPAPTVGQLRAGARRMVETLVSRHPMRLSKAQLATLSRMTVRGGTFTTYMSDLRRADLVVESDGLIQASATALHEFGSDVAPCTAPAEIRDVWRKALRAGARRMFDALIERHPSGFTRPELAATVEIEFTGGTFGTYMSDLRRNGLIEERDGVVTASDTLFM